MLLEPDYEKLLQRAVNTALGTCLTDPDSPERMWSTMSKILFDDAVLGYTRRQNVNWFGEDNRGIKVAVEKKRGACYKTE